MDLNLLHPAEQLAEMIKRIYDQRLTTTSGGNLSIKDENGDVWITPGAIDKGTLTRKDMVCIKADGTIIGRHKPSSEYPFHLKVYETRKDIHAVLHAHSPALVAFSIVRRIPDTTLLRQAYLECGKPGMAKYAMTGSKELGERIGEVFAEGHDVAMLENHGVVVGADTLIDAFAKFETMETLARMQINAGSLGPVHGIKEEDLTRSENCADSENVSAETAQAPQTAQYTSKEKAARKELCEFAARAYRQGLITGFQGSFSERVSEDRFVITPHHQDRLHLEPGDIAAIEAGKTEAGKIPSRDVNIHQAIYQAHPEISCVIICQPQNVMAFACTDEPLDSRTIPESYIMMRDIPRLAVPAFLEDPGKVAGMFNESTPIVLSENDCVIVTGQEMLKAFDRLEVTENSAMSIVMSKGLGEIVPIDEKGLEDIKKGFDLK